MKQTHQSTGEAHYCDGSLGRLRDVQQVVQKRLVLVVGKEIKLIQHKDHWATAVPVT